MAAVRALAADTAAGGPAMLVGSPWVAEGKLYNAVLLLDGGEIVAKRFEVDLPNYGVFDEKRVFASGPIPAPLAFCGVRLGVRVCGGIRAPPAVEDLEVTRAVNLHRPTGQDGEEVL